MKILVVDDEQSFGALLGHTLKRLGHKPVVATHPEDALELLTPDVDAVITDIDMPVMSGVELAQAIRAQYEEMPIAFCTGSAPEGRAVREAGEIGTVLPKVWTVGKAGRRCCWRCVSQPGLSVRLNSMRNSASSCSSSMRRGVGSEGSNFSAS